MAFELRITSVEDFIKFIEYIIPELSEMNEPAIRSNIERLGGETNELNQAVEDNSPESDQS